MLGGDVAAAVRQPKTYWAGVTPAAANTWRYAATTVRYASVRGKLANVSSGMFMASPKRGQRKNDDVASHPLVRTRWSIDGYARAGTFALLVRNSPPAGDSAQYL